MSLSWLDVTRNAKLQKAIIKCLDRENYTLKIAHISRNDVQVRHVIL